MEDFERAQARLENILSVQPILGALRTISLGSWQLALKQKGNAQRYSQQLTAMLPALLPHLPFRRLSQPRTDSKNQVVALVIGSERGLCGRFNAALVDYYAEYEAERAGAGDEIELNVLGSRAIRLFERQKRSLAWTGTLAATALPSAQLAFDLTRRWLTRYEAGELDAVDILINRYQNAGIYRQDALRLLPPDLSAFERDAEALWPPPIVETDALSLYTQVIGQLVTVRFHQMLLESAASEHAARFQLMESATQNTERIVTELTIAVQMAVRQAITREMQELAAGAGQLG